MDVSGDGAINGDLNVFGSSVFHELVQMKQDVDIGGFAVVPSVSGCCVMGGSCSVSSDLTAGSGISVRGTARFSDAVNVPSVLELSGSFSLASEAIFGSAISVNSDIVSGQSASVGSVLRVGNSVSIGSQMVHCNTIVSVDESLVVAGTFSIMDTMCCDVTGGLSMLAPVVVGSSLSAVSIIANNACVNGVLSSSSFAPTEVEEYLAVGGSVSVGSSALIEGPMSVNGIAHIRSSLLVTDRATIGGATQCLSTLFAAGITSCSAPLFTGSLLSCSGQAYLQAGFSSLASSVISDSVSIHGSPNVGSRLSIARGLFGG